MKIIDKATYDSWKDQPILHDEDQWSGKYRTYGEMWAGEGYAVEQKPGASAETTFVAKRTTVWHPRNPHVFGENDHQQLEAAKKLLLKVYEYHYGDSHMQKELGRLETIINKLEALQNLK